MARLVPLILVLGAVLVTPGCVRRTLSITSEPAGALVWLNDREVGRTPVAVEFVHYGVYDVRLECEGCEPLLTTGNVKPPVWDMLGPDFVAEVLPLELRSDVSLHYVLEPRDDDPVALTERARDLREAATTHDGSGGPTASAEPAGDDPDDGSGPP